MHERESGDLLWLSGAISFALAGLGIAVGVFSLFLAEGPGSPDILTTLTSYTGQQQIFFTVAGLTVGAVLSVIGLAIFFSFLRHINYVSMLISLSLTIVASASFVAIAAFHYSLVIVAREGFTADTGLRLYSVAAHYFADVAGWTGIACFAFSTLLIGLILRRRTGWKFIGYSGITIAIIALLLFLLDSSYLFLIPFSLWLLCVAIAFVINRKAIHQE